MKRYPLEIIGAFEASLLNLYVDPKISMVFDFFATSVAVLLSTSEQLLDNDDISGIKSYFCIANCIAFYNTLVGFSTVDASNGKWKIFKMDSNSGRINH